MGLRALCDAARLRDAPTPYHLGFMLGPRINAGGRIGDAALGARLLTIDDLDQARAIAEQLDRLNAERQAMEKEALVDAMAQAEAQIDACTPVTVISSPQWHPGIVG